VFSSPRGHIDTSAFGLARELGITQLFNDDLNERRRYGQIEDGFDDYSFPLCVKVTLGINALIGMSTEIVSLRFDQVCRQPGTAIAIEVSEGGH
jgi:hypothetical protein